MKKSAYVTFDISAYTPDDKRELAHSVLKNAERTKYILPEHKEEAVKMLTTPNEVNTFTTFRISLTSGYLKGKIARQLRDVYSIDTAELVFLVDLTSYPKIALNNFFLNVIERIEKTRQEAAWGETYRTAIMGFYQGVVSENIVIPQQLLIRLNPNLLVCQDIIKRQPVSQQKLLRKSIKYVLEKRTEKYLKLLKKEDK